jgi:hypothetical protein
MQIVFYILYLSMLVWIIPPFRQFKEGYFFYFLILAVSDPLIGVLNYAFKVHAHTIHITAGLLLIYSVQYYKQNRSFKFNHKNFFFALVTLFAVVNGNIVFIKTVLLLIHLMLFYYFLQLLLNNAKEEEEIKIYHIVLLFYEASIILKVLNLIIGTATGIVYFYITTAFGMLVAIFFIIYNLKNSPAISLKKERTKLS